MDVADGRKNPGEQEKPRKHRRVVRVGTEQEVVSGISKDERDTNWSQSSSAGSDSNDAQLLADVPPHWGGSTNPR